MARVRGPLAAVLLLAGVVLVGAGAGLALPHAAKTGWSAATGLGLVLLAGGVAGVVAGVLGVLRSTRRRWWLLTVPTMLLAAYAGASAVGTAVAATHVPPTPLRGPTPASVGLAFEPVTLRTADGVRLSGWYLPSRTGAAVALLHGSGSTRTAVLPQAAVLQRAGYGVLLYDARGHGASGGEAMDLGWHGESDVAAAVTFLAGRPDVSPDRIGAVGLSLGGEVAIGGAGADPRVRAVVAEGATGRVAADKAWLADYGLRGQVQRGVEWLTTRTTALLSDAAVPPPLHEAAAASGAPMLLVTAGEVPDERRAAELVRSGSPGTVTVWEVPGAGHTGGLRAHPAAWERRVVGFLDRALLS